MRTRLCELLSIEIPLIQAPIGGATTPRLVAAVSEAGALGMLSVTWRSTEQAASAVRETKQLTSRPFGINLALTSPPDEKLEACLGAGARIVSLFWGDPSPWIERIHDAGALVLATIGSAEEARRVVDAGVDIVVAQGWESGGHVWSKVAGLALIPRVVDAVPKTPVVAAGGIADGRGLAASLVLGAAGAWIGTRFLLAEEAQVHSRYRERLQAASEIDTTLTTYFDHGWPGAPHRVLRTDQVERGEVRPGAGDVIAHFADGRPIHRYEGTFPMPGMTGKLDDMALYAGQSVGLCHQILPAGKIVRTIREEAIQALGSAWDLAQKL